MSVLPERPEKKNSREPSGLQMGLAFTPFQRETLISAPPEAGTTNTLVTEAAVRRAGVWVLAPLGACFLPAFVCLGVVPLVIGIAGDALG